MEKNYYNKRPLLGGLVATAAIASVLSPASYNSSPANAENIQTAEETTTQALGTWAVSYSCQTDVFSVTAQTPSASHYDIKMYDNTNSSSAVVRQLDIVDQPSVDLQIPMTEAEGLGIQRDSNTEIAVIDTPNGQNVVAGTIVNTVGCPKEPEPTPTITPIITPEPSLAPTITTEPAPTYTPAPKVYQQVKMPKSNYRVGRKIKLPIRTKSGAPTTWTTFPSKNKNNKKVCKVTDRYLGLEMGKSLVRSKIITLRPGRCRYQVFSDGLPGEEFLGKNGSFKVVRKYKKSK